MAGVADDHTEGETPRQWERNYAEIENPLWIEQAAKAVGLYDREWLSDVPGLAPFALFAVIFAFDYGLLGAVQSLTRGFHPYLGNPAVVLLPVGLVFAIWAAQRFRNGYEAGVAGLLANEGTDRFPQSLGFLGRSILAVEGAGSIARGESGAVSRSDAVGDAGTLGEAAERHLRRLVSNRLKLVVLLVGWSFHASWLLFVPGSLEFVVDVQGPVGMVRFFGFMPLVYYPIAVDFFAVYVGGFLVFPFKLRATGLINFQDPLGYGQLRPFGDLIRSGGRYYFVAVVLYVLFTGFTAVFVDSDASIPGVSPLSVFGVTATIVGGVVLLALPIILLHGHLKEAKHRKIQELAADVEALGPQDDDRMFPETSVPESVDEGHAYIQYFIKITKVENTHEYPVDVSHIQELVLAAIVPFVAHVTVSLLATYVGNGGH